MVFLSFIDESSPNANALEGYRLRSADLHLHRQSHSFEAIKSDDTWDIGPGRITFKEPTKALMD